MEVQCQDINNRSHYPQLSAVPHPIVIHPWIPAPGGYLLRLACHYSIAATTIMNDDSERTSCLQPRELTASLLSLASYTHTY